MLHECTSLAAVLRAAPEDALSDDAGELAATVLARLPRPEDAPRLDERGRRELVDVRKDLEKKVARRAR